MNACLVLKPEIRNSIIAREKILNLQACLEVMQETNPVDCPLTHHFAPGLYAREILLPKDSLVVGKIHKHSHVNNISKGSVIVYTEFGMEEYHAPCQFVSKAGTKRAVLALEDTVWTTYHPTSEIDLAIIEEEVIAKSFDDYNKFALEQSKKLEVIL
jgi:hypothetical protein